jgi:2-polyprenyl-3-methyl-5-hydroxy-6-metoxy-1,4-benzoquinol methylase
MIGIKMTKEKGPEYYNSLYQSSEKYLQNYKDSRYYVLWTQVITFVRQFTNPNILEIGCGAGQFAHYLYDQGFRQYHGVDFSLEAIEVAKKTVNQSFSLGDCRNSEVYCRDYDLVIALEVLEHIKDDHTVLANIKDGTNIIFSLPTFNHPEHVRRFKQREAIEWRYRRNIDIKKIVRIDKWFVCWGVVGKYSPSIWKRLLRMFKI